MMDFFTRCCKKANATVGNLPAWCLAVLLTVFQLAWADGIEVRKAAVVSAEEGYVLTAEMDIKLTPVLDDALHKGVPLYFVLEFDLTRSRWYWTNEKLTTIQQPQRLAFNTLTRQYRVGVGALYQNFSSLQEALGYMSRVRRRLEMEPGALHKDNAYAAQMRLRFDLTQLPKPFQLHTGRDWRMASDWYRFVVQP